MTSRLVGREPELAELHDHLRGIEDSGRTVLVRGQPGVGKSSLLAATSAMARDQGALVLEASGIESEAMQAFAGLHQLLRPLRRQMAGLPAVQNRALTTALGAAQGPPPELFLTALAALTLLVDAASSRPVVAVVDDVHWLDAATIDVLAFVSRRLRHDAVILVAGLRDGHNVALTSVDASDIILHGLDAASSRELLATVAHGLTADDQQALLDQAEGNPLALVELPISWRSAGADVLGRASEGVPLTMRLEQAFAARMTELPSLTRDALLVTAVNGEQSLAEVLTGTAMLSGAEVTTHVLEPAVRARLVEFDQVRLWFRHPLIRAAVLSREPTERRQAAHAALSAVLQSEPHRQVWHESQAVAGPDDEVARRLDASHVESLRRGSPFSAIAALERSAELTSAPAVRVRRLLLAAQHAYRLGRADLVLRLVDAAETHQLSEEDRARAEWLREPFGRAAHGNSARVHELCDLAARSASSGQIDLALDLLAGAALRCWWAADSASDRRLVVRVAQGLTEVLDDPRCIAVIAVADPLGEVPETRRRLEAKAAAGVADVEQLRQLGLAARAVGAETLAADFLQGADAKLRESGQLGMLAQLLPVVAAVYLDLGDWQRAEQCLAEGWVLSQETGQSSWQSGTSAVAAVYEGHIGEVELALQHADDIEAECAGRNAGDFLALAHLARGAAYLTVGKPAEAYAALAPIFDPGERCHHPREQISALMLLVEAAVGCGAADEVRDVVARMEALAVTTTSPVLDVHLSYVRPVLAAGHEAEQLFKEGLVQDLTRWPWPRARLELAYGNWLRHERRPLEARAPLRSALATFEVLGARGWATQARTSLRAAGERGRVAGSPGGATMTAQEMQIARLAAQGLSNREIGQQLYLSPRTVGSHLYRIYPKLGITSRAQLAERLGPQ